MGFSSGKFSRTLAANISSNTAIYSRNTVLASIQELLPRMTDSGRVEHFDVVICGCGPTGALLSANLSRLGVKHVVLEREEGITTDPRGIALDEDGIRIVQGIGKYEELFTDVGKGISALSINNLSAYSS